MQAPNVPTGVEMRGLRRAGNGRGEGGVGKEAGGRGSGRGIRGGEGASWSSSPLAPSPHSHHSPRRRHDTPPEVGSFPRPGERERERARD